MEVGVRELDDPLCALMEVGVRELDDPLCALAADLAERTRQRTLDALHWRRRNAEATRRC